MFYDRTSKRRPFNAAGCLIEVTACASLTVFRFPGHETYCDIRSLTVNLTSKIKTELHLATCM